MKLVKNFNMLYSFILSLALHKKLEAYVDYAQDAQDYWESLKKAFDPSNPQNVQSYAERVNLLSEHAG